MNDGAEGETGRERESERDCLQTSEGDGEREAARLSLPVLKNKNRVEKKELFTGERSGEREGESEADSTYEERWRACERERESEKGREE